jgi:protein-S-isoprenylcysteine O-methyltransferase Ste14
VNRAVAALVLEVAFFALAFGWRSWIQWRRTGSTGFIRPRRGASPAELVGSGGFVLALVLLVAAPVTDLAGLPRIELLDTAGAAAAGIALGVCGVALTLVAQLAMGNSWRIGVDPAAHTDLVTGGVFGSVRNPIFTAMLIATAGLVLLVPNLVSTAAFVMLVAALEVQVRLVEEPYLRATHGSAYDSYLATVGRFVPRVGLEPVPR